MYLSEHFRGGGDATLSTFLIREEMQQRDGEIRAVALGSTFYLPLLHLIVAVIQLATDVPAAPPLHQRAQQHNTLERMAAIFPIAGAIAAAWLPWPRSTTSLVWSRE